MKNEAITDAGLGGEGSIGDAEALELTALKDALEKALCRAFQWVTAILMA
jgi:hypothetical protein